MATPEVWPPARVATLRALWAAGIVTSAIAREMGTTKRAVIGKARRIGLVARPSPIRRPDASSTVPQPPARPRRAPRRTLTPTAAVQSVAGLAPPAPRPEAVYATHRPARLCCWPLGHPRDPGFRFCDAPSHPGRPYCAAHCVAAYVRPPAWRDDAA